MTERPSGRRQVAAQDGNRTLLKRAGTAAAGVGSIGARRPRLRAALQIVLLLLIFGFLGAFVVTQWGRLPDYSWRFRPGWLALSALLVATFYVASAEVWRLILRALGEPLDRATARAIWGKSILARYVPTSALIVVGRVVLAEREGVSKRTCLASIAYEIGLGVSAALIVGSYLVATLSILEDEPVRFAVFLVIPLVLAGLHPRVFVPVANWAFRKLGRDPLPASLPFSRVVLLLFPFVALWTLIGIGVYAFAASLYPVSVSDLPVIAASYAAAFCVAVLIFVIPGGLGTREATLATALTEVLPGTVAVAIAVAFRIFQTAVELAFVGVAVLIARRRVPCERRS